MTDPYEVLGISRDATHDEVREAYRNLVKATHPDAGGTADEFAKVKAAAAILLDEDKRKLYDEEGILDGDQPDNLISNANENIAQFFVNSINAATQNRMAIEGLDLVQGAEKWFSQKLAETSRHIADVEHQIKNFEKAIKRLKTKRKKDVISVMLSHHVSGLRTNIHQNKHQMSVYKKAIDILRDYEFEAPDPALLLGKPLSSWRFEQ